MATKNGFLKTFSMVILFSMPCNLIAGYFFSEPTYQFDLVEHISESSFWLGYVLWPFCFFYFFLSRGDHESKKRSALGVNSFETDNLALADSNFPTLNVSQNVHNENDYIYEEKLRIIFEYEKLASGCHDELKSIDPGIAEVFKRKVLTDPQSATQIRDQLIEEHNRKLAPFDSPLLNGALYDAREIGVEAEREFKRVVESLGEKIDVDYVINKLRKKYRSTDELFKPKIEEGQGSPHPSVSSWDKGPILAVLFFVFCFIFIILYAAVLDKHESESNAESGKAELAAVMIGISWSYFIGSDGLINEELALEHALHVLKTLEGVQTEIAQSYYSVAANNVSVFLKCSVDQDVRDHESYEAFKSLIPLGSSYAIDNAAWDLFWSGRDYQKFLDFKKDSTDKDFLDVYTNALGDRLPHDVDEAFRVVKKYATTGDHIAAKQLGFYYECISDAPDLDQALSWYTRSLEYKNNQPGVQDRATRIALIQARNS